MTRTVAYGDQPDQHVIVHDAITPRTDAATVVLVHGGFWRDPYRAELMEPLARNLAARGYTVVNIEYRRVGGGGGWPETFDDVAAAIDSLPELDVPTTRVVVVGHSAGGHLAAWAASRGSLSEGMPGTPVGVMPCAVVSLAGVIDLHRAADEQLGGSAAAELLGGDQTKVPDRYLAADPARLVPPAGPVLLVHGVADDLVPLSQSHAYADAVRAAGGEATVREVDGDHFTVIDPRSAAWAIVVDFLDDTCR